jgi:hypothetical protein
MYRTFTDADSDGIDRTLSAVGVGAGVLLPGGLYGKALKRFRRWWNGPGDAAFHYTFKRFADSIKLNGLRPGQLSGKIFATPNGGLTPEQAMIELALDPERGLPDALIKIDLEGLRRAGYHVPDPTTVGQKYGMAGGGEEIVFDYVIPGRFLEIVPR